MTTKTPPTQEIIAASFVALCLYACNKLPAKPSIEVVYQLQYTKNFHLDDYFISFQNGFLHIVLFLILFTGLDDIAIPLSQFEKLNLPIKKVMVVENKTTLYTTLTLPSMNNAIAIFGSGYSVYNLKNVGWFTNLELLYWGDIDVQGFEILSQFRGYFPQTKSVFMDKVTFDKYFENDLGTVTNVKTQLNLTNSEQELYDILKTNNWRLEQEKIPFEYVNEFFDK